VNGIRPGGVAQDLPLGLCRDIDSSTQQFASRIDKLTLLRRMNSSECFKLVHKFGLVKIENALFKLSQARERREVVEKAYLRFVSIKT